MDELTRRRLAHNEQTFRAVNDEVVAAHNDPRGRRIAFICECSNRSCTERIFLTEAEYDAVRHDERRFIVRPGHTVAEIEHVVDDADGYVIVQKRAA